MKEIPNDCFGYKKRNTTFRQMKIDKDKNNKLAAT